MSDAVEHSPVVDLTVAIVSAYLSHNHVSAGDLPGLIRSVHAAIDGLAAGHEAEATPVPHAKATAHLIRRSITPDALISFEDGKPYKTLKRHLRTLGMTPEAYRAKWGLPGNYPMTAASYAEQRSRIAKELGLGHARRQTPAAGAQQDGASEPEDGKALPGEPAQAAAEAPQRAEADTITHEPFEEDGALV